MTCKTKILTIFLISFSIFLLSITLTRVVALQSRITTHQYVYFGFGTNTYINSPTSQSFQNIYRDSSNIWHFDNYLWSAPSGNLTLDSFSTDPPITPPSEEPPIIIPGEPEIVLPSPKQIQDVLALLYPHAPAIYLGAVVISVAISSTYLYGRTKRSFRNVLGGPYNPHAKRVTMKVKKTGNVRLKLKKSRTPKIKKKDLYD